MLREPDGKAPVLHAGKTRLDPATEYHSRVFSSVAERLPDTQAARCSIHRRRTIMVP